MNTHPPRQAIGHPMTRLSLLKSSLPKSSLLKSFATFAATAGLLVASLSVASPGIASELELGSKAPPLDIEHWVYDGAFDAVTDFKQDRIYVVEFWGTHCGPCIQMMPRLAELQSELKDNDVQIIGVATESL